MQIIVVVDENWAIGKAGDQITRIKADLKRFKELTEDTILVYGRNTLDTFPGGKVLPGRENWVLSNKDSEIDGAAKVFNDLDSLLRCIKEAEAQGKKVSCIGGGSVYKQLLPYTDTCYVTYIYKEYEDTDTFFPDISKMPEWQLVSQSELYTAGKKEPIKYRFLNYERK